VKPAGKLTGACKGNAFISPKIGLRWAARHLGLFHLLPAAARAQRLFSAKSTAIFPFDPGIAADAIGPSPR